jgi:pimeloyl-ACP methyl ester carboxylesterase
VVAALSAVGGPSHQAALDLLKPLAKAAEDRPVFRFAMIDADESECLGVVAFACSIFPARARATSRPGRTRPPVRPTRSPLFLGAIGIERAHVARMSFGAAVGLHLAARHPGRVRSLSLHSGWHASDDYLKIVVVQWCALASTLPTVADVVIEGIFPWCFTPEMYVERPEFVETLVEFVRGRPAQPVDAFMAQTDAVLAHDARGILGGIDVPTLITFGARDLVCSTRFAEPLKSAIAGSELSAVDVS